MQREDEVTMCHTCVQVSLSFSCVCVCACVCVCVYRSSQIFVCMCVCLCVCVCRTHLSMSSISCSTLNLLLSSSTRAGSSRYSSTLRHACDTRTHRNARLPHAEGRATVKLVALGTLQPCNVQKKGINKTCKTQTTQTQYHTRAGSS